MTGFDYRYHPVRSKFMNFPFACERWEAIRVVNTTLELLVVNEDKMVHLCGMTISGSNTAPDTRAVNVRVTNAASAVRLQLVYRFLKTNESDWLSINYDPPVLMKYSDADRIQVVSNHAAFELNVNAWGFETLESSPA